MRRDVVRKLLAINGFQVRPHVASAPDLPSGESDITPPKIYIDGYYRPFEQSLSTELRELLVAIDQVLKKCDSQQGSDNMKKLHKHIAFAFDHHEVFEDSIASAQSFLEKLEQATKGSKANPPKVQAFDKLMVQWIPRTKFVKSRIRALSSGILRRLLASQDLVPSAFTWPVMRALLKAAACVSPMTLKPGKEKWHEEWDLQCPHKRVCFHTVQDQSAEQQPTGPTKGQLQTT